MTVGDEIVKEPSHNHSPDIASCKARILVGNIKSAALSSTAPASVVRSAILSDVKAEHILYNTLPF